MAKSHPAAKKKPAAKASQLKKKPSCGKCIYVKRGGDNPHWDLVDSTCTGGCTCKKPKDKFGQPGDIIIMHCRPKRLTSIQVCACSCQFTASGSGWTPDYTDCDAGCDCSQPDFSPADVGMVDGDHYQTDCGPTL